MNLPRALMICLLLSPVVPAVAQDGSATTTVSVPLAAGDSATVTGPLAIRQRGTRQFLVIESPTPYRLLHDHQAGARADKVVRDIPIALAGRDAELQTYSGQTITASGRLRFLPAATSWNGALLESSVVVLPGGKELRAKR